LKRRTFTLRDDDWLIIYETAVYLTRETGRHCSLAQAFRVIFSVLKQQDWFRANKDELLKAYKALSEHKEVSDADASGARGDRITLIK
jgi:hypothetical protein